jgi:hypothetical protein
MKERGVKVYRDKRPPERDWWQDSPETSQDFVYSFDTSKRFRS